MIDRVTWSAFLKEAASLTGSLPGMKVPGVKAPTAGAALGNLQNGGVKPPSVPNIGVAAPKVV